METILATIIIGLILLAITSSLEIIHKKEQIENRERIISGQMRLILKLQNEIEELKKNK